jgi:hypothetical protein
LTETTETPVAALTPFQEWSAIPDSEQVISSEAEIDTASETEPASDPDKPAVEDKEEKLPKGLKKRFSELTSEIRELRTQLALKPAAGEEKPGVATLPKADTKATQPGEPEAKDFDTYEAYVKASVRWEIAQDAAVKAAADARASAAATVKTQVEAARARHDDYDQVVTDQVPISPAMAEVLVAMEHGAEVAYVLGSDPAKAARIAKLTPARAGAALAHIEAGLDLEKPSTETKPKTAISKAPTPPKILNGSGGNADAEPDPKDFTKWSKWADREDKRKRGE